MDFLVININYNNERESAYFLINLAWYLSIFPAYLTKLQVHLLFELRAYIFQLYEIILIIVTGLFFMPD